MSTFVELRSHLTFSFLALLALAIQPSIASAQSSSASEGWVTAWQASPTAGGTYTGAPCPSGTGLNGQTVRNLVYPSAGGEEIRVRLSNLGGTAPLRVGAASIAASGSGAAAVGSTLHALTFSGQSSTVIAAESEALSDPIALQTYSLSELAVSVYLPAATGAATTHYYATQTNYLGKGNLTAAASASGFTQPISCWMFVSGVEIKSTSHFKASLIALGDSITDGYQSTTSANNRYPDYLARRLAALSGATLAVSNAGLSGNKLIDDWHRDLRPSRALPL